MEKELFNFLGYKEQKDLLKKEAKRRDVSLKFLMNEIIEEYIKRKKLT